MGGVRVAAVRTVNDRIVGKGMNGMRRNDGHKRTKMLTRPRQPPPTPHGDRSGRRKRLHSSAGTLSGLGHKEEEN